MWFQKPPLGTPLDWGNPLNDGTVLALAMYEGHGDKVQDLSLNGNHGTLNNFAFPPTTTSGWNPAQRGIGINFDGTDDYIDCGDVGLSGKDLTISFFANQSSTTASWESLVSFGTGKFRFETGNPITKWWIFDSGIDALAIGIDAAVVNGEWSNIVFTSDQNNWRVYSNGIEKTSGSTDGDINASTFYLGARAGAGPWWGGSIDQPRIQSRAWSAKEVRDYAINPWQVYLDE